MWIFVTFSTNCSLNAAASALVCYDEVQFISNKPFLVPLSCFWWSPTLSPSVWPCTSISLLLLWIIINFINALSCHTADDGPWTTRHVARRSWESIHKLQGSQTWLLAAQSFFWCLSFFNAISFILTAISFHFVFKAIKVLSITTLTCLVFSQLAMILAFCSFQIAMTCSVKFGPAVFDFLSLLKVKRFLNVGLFVLSCPSLLLLIPGNFQFILILLVAVSLSDECSHVM